MTVSELASDEEYSSDDSKGGKVHEISAATDEHLCPFAAEFSCKEKFMRETDAIQHSCSQLGGVTCTICDKVCTDWDTLGIHIDNDHPQEEKPQVTIRPTAPKVQGGPKSPLARFRCPYAEKYDCTQTYKSRENAERHGKTHTTKIPCPYAAKYGCTKLFGRGDIANRHGKTHIEEWSCPLCLEVYQRRERVVKHLKEFHGTNGTQQLAPRAKGADHATRRATSQPTIKEVLEKSRVPTIEALRAKHRQAMLEFADAFGRDLPDEISVLRKRGHRKHSPTINIATEDLPTILEEVDDEESGIYINSDSPTSSSETVVANSIPATKPLRPTLKQSLSSTSALTPSSPGNTIDSSPKKQVRFSSPIDDGSPRPSPRIRSISQVYKSASLHPQFGDITFYHSSTHGYCAILTRRNISYSHTEDKHLLINRHQRFKSNELNVDPIIRASRWGKDDKSFSFYYAQLLHRGLLTTRDKEVAKWRIYHQTALGQTKEQTRQRLIYVSDINDELKQALRYALPNLKDQGRSVDHDEPDWDDGSEGEVKNWMVEEPKPAIMSGQEYNQVMNQWIARRNRLLMPESNGHNSGDELRQRTLAGYSITRRPTQLDSTQATDGYPNHRTPSLSHPPRPDCLFCHFPQLECDCAPCPRCSKTLNWHRRVMCRCYCEDCHRPIARAFDVKRESAPPGYYCRCKVDPHVKEHFDEVRMEKRKVREEALRKANAGAKDNDEEDTVYIADNYDEIERMTKEWRAEMEAKEKAEERARMRKEKGKGKLHWSEEVEMWVESDDEDAVDSRRKPEGAQNHTSPSPSDEQRRKINMALPKQSTFDEFFDTTDSEFEYESYSSITSCSDDPQDDTPYADRVAWKPSDPNASILDYICVECDVQLRHCECPSRYKEAGRLPSGWEPLLSAPTIRSMEEYVRRQLDGANDDSDDEDMRLGDSVSDQKKLLVSLLPPPSWQPSERTRRRREDYVTAQLDGANNDVDDEDMTFVESIRDQAVSFSSSSPPRTSAPSGSDDCQTKIKSPPKLAHQKKRNKKRTRKHSSGAGEQKLSMIDGHECKSEEQLKGHKRPLPKAEGGQPHPKRRKRKRSGFTNRDPKEAAKDNPSPPQEQPDDSATAVDSDEPETDHVAIKTRMTNWVLRHASVLPTAHRNSGASHAISLESMCGRYELVSARADKSGSKHTSGGVQQGTSELILKSDGVSMYGRFRLEDGMHGLLKIPNIPEKSSTGGVTVHAVVEDHVTRDGSWIVPVERDGKSLVAGKMMFLGAGFVVVVHKRLGKTVFGVRVGHEYEEGRIERKAEGVKESWNSICEKFGGRDCRESGGELQEVTWDEEAIDELVDCLGES